MASRLQDVIGRGLAADRPLATDVAPGTLYFSTDLNKTERSDGTTWETYSDIPSGGVTPSAHHTTHESGGSDAVTLAQAQVTGLVAALAGKASTTHASTHLPGGSDPIVIRKQFTLIIDGGASVLTTGYKGWASVPVAGTLKKWRILADVSGSIVIDVWKDVFANYPPTVADTITASAKPTLSGALSAESSTLTGWNTAFSAGDVFGFNVDSVASVKKVSLTLEYE